MSVEEPTYSEVHKLHLAKLGKVMDEMIGELRNSEAPSNKQFEEIYNRLTSLCKITHQIRWDMFNVRELLREARDV